MSANEWQCFFVGVSVGALLEALAECLGTWLRHKRRHTHATTVHPWPCDDPEQARRFASLVDRLRDHDRMARTATPTAEEITASLERIREAATRYRHAVIEAATDDAVRLLEAGRTWDALEVLWMVRRGLRSC